MKSAQVLVLILALFLFAAPAFSAKNVILMIGDGMSYQQVRAGSYYLTGASGGLCFEPYHKCGVTTYSLNNPVTDSAAAATALATGHKTNNGIISQSPTGEVYQTILEQAEALGKSTGLVTTDEITGATPAGFGAHDPSRGHATAITDDYLNSSRPEVIFGGGDPNRGGGCVTSAQVTTATQAGYQVVYDSSHMAALNPATAKLCLGLFSGKTMTLEKSREPSCAEPHLSQMTTKALELVAGDPDGFFLMIEGACIDKCGHRNDIEGVTFEVVEFNKAVQTVLTWLAGRNDTLLIVTADHETGGLTTTDNGKGNIPGATWTGGGHTNANVGFYATGDGSDLVKDYVKNGAIDNTDVYRVMSAAIAPKPTAAAK